MNQSQTFNGDNKSAQTQRAAVESQSQDLPKQTSSGAPVGEGGYEGTAGYAARLGRYLATADVSADAKAAAPKSSAEAAEMLAADREAANRSRANEE